MPRSGRVLVDEGAYYVFTHGNNGQPVFHHEADFQRYLGLLAASACAHQVAVYHFALLPTHVHLIVQVARGQRLSKAMHRLNLTYALYYRSRYHYRGHLWQGRFKSLLVNSHQYLLACGRYVELQPVRAGLVQEPAAHRWSSYHVYAQGREDPVVTLNPLYAALGSSPTERQQRYRQFASEGLAVHETRAREGRQALVSESSQLLRPLEELMGFPAGWRRPGRPRKHALVPRNIAPSPV